MENKESPPKNKAKFNQEEKLIRKVDYDAFAGVTRLTRNQPLQMVSDKLSKNSNFKHCTQKVIVSIKPKAPAIKTLYIAERNRFHPKKNSESGSRLAVGDHSSFTTRLTDDNSSTITSEVSILNDETNCLKYKFEKDPISTEITTTTTASKYSNTDTSQYIRNLCNQRREKKCYGHLQPHKTMTLSKVKLEEILKSRPNKVDVGTLIVSNSSSENIARMHSSHIDNIYKKINKLEKKILKQEMVVRSIDPNVSLSSSDNENQDNECKAYESNNWRPGSSYVEYSHVPETSAFQRYSQQPAPLSASKATTIQKEHNSEQYGRDFTLYDNVTARGRRQCASVPCKRNDVPKLAAERVHKIRHKLNPVRDYRLMDTVHYLAQGEFAPRDDGIKLTPSREAVLSDIIYEDVCRTHWPNTRLGRRVIHPERISTRTDLQRLIDSLLRERVAHIERRRRRHYRIVKLNHRHENCRPVGKTGDIIVASHKNKTHNEDEIPLHDHVIRANIDQQQSSSPRKSHDQLLPERPKRRFEQDDSSPGPSNINRHSNSCREPTCCYHTSNPAKPTQHLCSNKNPPHTIQMLDETSGSSITTSKIRPKTPRLVVKKNSSLKKHNSNEPNLEHFILLPTLVVRTPSNVKRQKKFNELYHRILNVQINNAQEETKSGNRKMLPEPDKKDIGFNINITLSESEEKL